MSRRNRFTNQELQKNLNRFQSTNRRLDDVDREFQSIRQRLDEFRDEKVDITSNIIDNQRLMVGNKFNALQSRLNAFEYSSGEALETQARYFNSIAEEINNEFVEQTDQLREYQSLLLLNFIEQSYASQQAIIDQIHESSIGFQDSANFRDDVAWGSYQNLLDLENEINLKFTSNPKWQRELPGIQLQLDQIHTNLTNNFEEAAIAGAQYLTRRLFEINQNLEAENQSRQNTLFGLNQIANEIIEAIKINRRVKAIDLSGNPLPQDLDVDFWSGGQLRLLFNHVKQILKYLDDSSQDISDDYAQLNNVLFELGERIPHLVNKARVQALSSQLRFNIAECILAALTTQGYELYFGGYADGDLLRTYQMTFHNLGGNEIYALISPVPDYPLNHDLNLEINEKEAITEHEIHYRNQEIDRALSFYGLKIGQNFGPNSIFKPTPDIKKSSTPSELTGKRLIQSFQLSSGKDW